MAYTSIRISGLELSDAVLCLIVENLWFIFRLKEATPRKCLTLGAHLSSSVVERSAVN